MQKEFTCDKCKNYTHSNKGTVTRHRNKCGKRKKPNDTTNQSVENQNSSGENPLTTGHNNEPDTISTVSGDSQQDGSSTTFGNMIPGSGSKNQASISNRLANQKKSNKTKSTALSFTENVAENDSDSDVSSITVSSSQETSKHDDAQSDGSTDTTIIEIKVKKREAPNSTIVTHHRRFQSAEQKNALINGIGKIGLKIDNAVNPRFETFVQG